MEHPLYELFLSPWEKATEQLEFRDRFPRSDPTSRIFQVPLQQRILQDSHHDMKCCNKRLPESTTPAKGHLWIFHVDPHLGPHQVTLPPLACSLDFVLQVHLPRHGFSVLVRLYYNGRCLRDHVLRRELLHKLRLNRQNRHQSSLVHPRHHLLCMHHRQSLLLQELLVRDQLLRSPHIHLVTGILRPQMCEPKHWP